MPDLDTLFDHLKAIMATREEHLEVVTDAPGNYYLNTTKPDEKGKPIFFGMVKTGKGKVAYHLMPVYCNPELLSDLSDALRDRMQGKSCFQFQEEDESLFSELSALTERGYEAYKADGKV